jgi:glucose/mannose-6-phosphate isomerase
MKEIYVLDDANVVAERDQSDALGLAANTPEQLLHNFGVQPIEGTNDIQHVVFSAMGGSALQAEFARTWPQLSIPFVVSKDYDIPSFVNEHTLFIAASYSGNTEESLEALEKARTKGAQIAVMAGGGTLKEIAAEHNDLFIEIPKAVQPRMAVFYGFRALIEIFVAHGLVDKEKITELEAVVDGLKASVEMIRKEVSTNDNPAKQLALQLVGKTPIVYAGPLMTPAAYKWKISFNESSKNTAWMGTFSEFNHNEFMGWTSHPIEKPFAVIDLLSTFEHERIQKRFELSDKLLSGMRPKAISVHAQGSTPLEQLLFLVLFGDFVSLYLGLLNGLDPSPVELVERFKKELNN